MADTYKALATVTVGAGGAATIDFQNIPQTYTDLVLISSLRNTSTAPDAYIRVNNQSSSYRNIYLYNNGGTVASISDATGTGYYTHQNRNWYTANTFSNNYAYIPNYTSNAVTKVAISDMAPESNETSIIGPLITSGIYQQSDAITRLTLIPGNGSFAQHSTATLYGVFNADVSSAPATPTIGTASALGEGALVPFTPVSNAASYVATSSPGSISAINTQSPIYVTGLTPNTSYTFTVRAQNPFGLSGASAASNSITAATDGWENLASVVSNGTIANASFTSISQSYKHLAILYSIRTSQTGGQAHEELFMRFNGVGGTSYGYQTTYVREDLNNPFTQQQANVDVLPRLVTPSSTTSAGTWGYGIIYIYNYSNTNMNKNVSALTGYSTPTNTSSAFQLVYMSGVFASTTAVSSILLQSGNFRTWANGSRISLYGIRG